MLDLRRVEVALADARTTDTIADDCNPTWSNPATFLFDVHESSQQCHLAVFDSESDNFNTFSDALLGIASFSMSSLQGRKRVIQRRFNVGVLEAIPRRKHPRFEFAPRDDRSSKNEPNRVEIDRDTRF